MNMAFVSDAAIGDAALGNFEGAAAAEGQAHVWPDTGLAGTRHRPSNHPSPDSSDQSGN
jgi:hypothetical protein